MRACLLVLALTLVACGGAGAGGSPSPIGDSPAPSASLAQAELKYRLFDRFGELLFCDPDFYPVARADEGALAHDRLPTIRQEVPTFKAILSRLHLPDLTAYSADQELAIYRDWKKLNALRFEQVTAGFHFIAIFGSPSTRQGTRVDGTIDANGVVAIASQTVSGAPPCPICLARGTRIATPHGEVPVEEVRVGDVIWTADAGGRRIAAPIAKVGTTAVPSTHRVVHLVLSDGRTVDVSPGHPTADGRTVGELAPDDAYDGATVTSAERIAYLGGATFDLLPASATGVYWANGVLLGSTLR